MVKKSKIKKPVKSVAKKKAAKRRVKSPKVKKMVSKSKASIPPRPKAPKRKTAAEPGKRNLDLTAAKAGKQAEFYTQWVDIEKEMNAYLEYDPNVFRDKIVLLPCDDPEWSNFAKFFALHFMDYGIKKLISTSYAPNSKPSEVPYQLTLFEKEAPQFDTAKTRTNGKKFVLEEKDMNDDGVVNIEDLQWEYLNGDGDFRSDEVTALKDEADIVMTNPPFFLFKAFLSWIVTSGKKCVILGNVNAVTYKEIFPLVKANQLWLGPSITSGDREFRVPDNYPLTAAGCRTDENGNKFIRVKGVRWFTSLDHGRRHEPLRLMTMADNIKHSKHKEVRDVGYQTYENYDALEVGFTDAIPSDYKGIMGVPITFLDKYNPEQFEILGMCENEDLYGLKTRVYNRDECKAAYWNKFGRKGSYDLNASGVIRVGGIQEKVYQRILIRHKGLKK